MVLGPGAVPRVESEEVAAAWPELGVFSALSYPHDFAVVRAAQAALRSAFKVDEMLATLYNDMILAGLSPELLARPEATMRPEEYEFQSEWARKHIAIGREQGREEGREEQAARAILEVFAARELPVPAEVRERIVGCTDLELLAVWLRRAVKASSAAEIFEQ